jgi:hypothetical protein
MLHLVDRSNAQIKYTASAAGMQVQKRSDRFMHMPPTMFFVMGNDEGNDAVRKLREYDSDGINLYSMDKVRTAVNWRTYVPESWICDHHTCSLYRAIEHLSVCHYHIKSLFYPDYSIPM